VEIAGNSAIVRNWFRTINDRDTHAEQQARSPHFVAHIPGSPGPLDGAGWEMFISILVGGFPDMHLAVEDVIADGDRVAVRWTFHGTHTGAFLGIEPTGRRVTMSAIEINRVEDGKIAEHWVQLDQLGILQQLGALPGPE
jgi:predicted ester cyclase